MLQLRVGSIFCRRFQAPPVVAASSGHRFRPMLNGGRRITTRLSILVFRACCTANETLATTTSSRSRFSLTYCSHRYVLRPFRSFPAFSGSFFSSCPLIRFAVPSACLRCYSFAFPSGGVIMTSHSSPVGSKVICKHRTGDVPMRQHLFFISRKQKMLERIGRIPSSFFFRRVFQREFHSWKSQSCHALLCGTLGPLISNNRRFALRVNSFPYNNRLIFRLPKCTYFAWGISLSGLSSHVSMFESSIFLLSECRKSVSNIQKPFSPFAESTLFLFLLLESIITIFGFSRP